ADRVMRMMRERIDECMARIEDPLERITGGVREFLEFFGEYPHFVELLIQERALFRDRTRPTFIEHREMYVDRLKAFYRDLIEQGRVRNVPVDRITDVLGSLLYGTIFMNYFSGSSKSVADQANDVIDVVFRGILEPKELCRLGQAAVATKDRVD